MLLRLWKNRQEFLVIFRVRLLQPSEVFLHEQNLVLLIEFGIVEVSIEIVLVFVQIPLVVTSIFILEVNFSLSIIILIVDCSLVLDCLSFLYALLSLFLLDSQLHTLLAEFNDSPEELLELRLDILVECVSIWGEQDGR